MMPVEKVNCCKKITAQHDQKKLMKVKLPAFDDKCRDRRNS